MDLEKYYQCRVNIEIYLFLKLCFFPLTYKINNLIALCLTTQINEISASWISYLENMRKALVFCFQGV